MSGQKTRFAISAFLAISLVLLLAGTSFFFPQQEATSRPDIPHPGNIGTPVIFPRITIKADGTIDPPTAPLTRVNNVYALTEDISNYTIEVQSNNIIIDGANHKLVGKDGVQGIEIANRANVAIQNIELSQFAYGINITSSTNITITKNKIFDVGSRGIALDSTTNSTLTENTLTNAYIELINSANNTISQNNFATSTYGINSGSSSCDSISQNTFHSIYYPIVIVGNVSTIADNSMRDGISAISIEGQGNRVVHNTMNEYAESGISLNRAINNVFYENTISNAKQGVMIGIGGQQNEHAVENNTFSQNSFLSNSLNVFIGTSHNHNFWNENKYGNYWSDYNGTDSDDNGIGDTPYVINGSNVDSYPLMNAHVNTLEETQRTPRRG